MDAGEEALQEVSLIPVFPYPFAKKPTSIGF